MHTFIIDCNHNLQVPKGRRKKFCCYSSLNQLNSEGCLVQRKENSEIKIYRQAVLQEHHLKARGTWHQNKAAFLLSLAQTYPTTWKTSTRTISKLNQLLMKHLKNRTYNPLHLQVRVDPVVNLQIRVLFK